MNTFQKKSIIYILFRRNSVSRDVSKIFDIFLFNELFSVGLLKKKKFRLSIHEH